MLCNGIFLCTKCNDLICTRSGTFAIMDLPNILCNIFLEANKFLEHLEPIKSFGVGLVE